MSPDGCRGRASEPSFAREMHICNLQVCEAVRYLLRFHECSETVNYTKEETKRRSNETERDILSSCRRRSAKWLFIFVPWYRPIPFTAATRVPTVWLRLSQMQALARADAHGCRLRFFCSRHRRMVTSQKRPRNVLPAVASWTWSATWGGQSKFTFYFLTGKASSATLVARSRFLPGPVRPFHRWPDRGEVHTRSRTCFRAKG